MFLTLLATKLRLCAGSGQWNVGEWDVCHFPSSPLISQAILGLLSLFRSRGSSLGQQNSMWKAEPQDGRKLHYLILA